MLCCVIINLPRRVGELLLEQVRMTGFELVMTVEHVHNLDVQLGADEQVDADVADVTDHGDLLRVEAYPEG